MKSYKEKALEWKECPTHMHTLCVMFIYPDLMKQKFAINMLKAIAPYLFAETTKGDKSSTDFLKKEFMAKFPNHRLVKSKIFL